MTIIVLLLFLITKRKPPKVNNYLSSALVTDATVNNIHSPRGLLGTPVPFLINTIISTNHMAVASVNFNLSTGST